MMTTYTRADGTQGQASVTEGSGRRGRTCLRDRIARLHLDAINPDLASAFDSPVWVGMDLSSKPDTTASWVKP